PALLRRGVAALDLDPVDLANGAVGGVVDVAAITVVQDALDREGNGLVVAAEGQVDVVADLDVARDRDVAVAPARGVDEPIAAHDQPAGARRIDRLDRLGREGRGPKPGKDQHRQHAPQRTYPNP